MNQTTEKQKKIQLMKIKCPKCGRLLGKMNGSYEIKCKRCKTIVSGSTDY